MAVICLLGSYPINSLSKEIESIEEIRARFIVNYMRFVTWPESVYKKGDDIVVCTMKGDLTAAHLRESKSSFTLKIKEQNRRSNIDDCHVFFIGEEYKDDIDRIISVAAGKPILTLSDSPGFCKRGGIGGFIFGEGENPVLEVNVKSLRKSKIKFAPDFQSIMKIVAVILKTKLIQS